MTQETKQKDDKQLRVTVNYDRNAMNPLKWNDLKIHEQREKPRGYENVLPLYKYEHGRVAYSTTSFRSRWDSGQVGYVTSDELDKETIKSFMENEYTDWCNGDVFNLLIEEITHCECCGIEQAEVIDSIGGIYSDVYKDNDVKALCEEYFNETPDEIERKF